MRTETLQMRQALIGSPRFSPCDSLAFIVHLIWSEIDLGFGGVESTPDQGREIIETFFRFRGRSTSQESSGRLANHASGSAEGQDF